MILPANLLYMSPSWFVGPGSQAGSGDFPASMAVSRQARRQGARKWWGLEAWRLPTETTRQQESELWQDVRCRRQEAGRKQVRKEEAA